MIARLVVFPRGGHEAIFDEEIGSIEDDLDRVCRGAACATALRGTPGPVPPVESYFVLERRDLLPGFCSDEGLKRLGTYLADVHAAAWGSPLHLVVDQYDVADALRNPKLHALVWRWARSVLSYDVADLLVMSEDELREPGVLGATRRRSRERQQYVARQAGCPLGIWRMALPVPSSLPVEPLPAPGILACLGVPSDRQWSWPWFEILILDHRAGQEKEFREWEKQNAGRARLVMVLGNNVDTDMLHAAKARGISVLECGHELELKYPPACMEIVEDSRRVFGTRPADQRPKVLITNSFDMSDEYGRTCFSAASVCAGMCKEAAPETETHLLLKATPSAVALIAKKLQHIDLWAHLGHGRESGELLGADGKWLPASDWVEAFRRAKEGVEAVVLGVCQSDRTARAFAEAGATLAVGFRSGVFPEALHDLIRDTIPLMLDAREFPRRYTRWLAELQTRLSKGELGDVEPVIFIRSSKP